MLAGMTPDANQTHSAGSGSLLEALKALCPHQVFEPACRGCGFRRLAVLEHLADLARRALTGVRSEGQVCSCGTWDDPTLAHAPDCDTRVTPPEMTQPE